MAISDVFRLAEFQVLNKKAARGDRSKLIEANRRVVESNERFRRLFRQPPEGSSPPPTGNGMATRRGGGISPGFGGGGPSPLPTRFTVSGGGGGSDPFGGGGGQQNGGFIEGAEKVIDLGERIAGLFGFGGEGSKREGKALVAKNEPAQDCPTGTVKVGNRCVSPGDVFPGGDPFITQAGGQTRMGAFGMPAVTPVQEQRIHRSCPSGMVLGKDNLCYPRAVLPRRSRFRKWRPGMKPLLTGGDRKAIRKAESVANKLMGEKKRLRKAKNALNKVL